jgi:hypothetical protein
MSTGLGSQVSDLWATNGSHYPCLELRSKSMIEDRNIEHIFECESPTYTRPFSNNGMSNCP